MKRDTCYMCAKAATSDEHAPPKCLFPEQKDASGIDYRKNLVTVRSCDEHNSHKSRDDEYLLHCLAGSFTSSSVGLQQFITKVQRAFVRSPSTASAFLSRSEHVMLKRAEDPEWEKGARVTIEAHRIDEVLDHCARALYFHETKKKFLGPARVMTNFTMYSHAEVQAGVTASFEATEAYFANRPPKGENPDVFWYKFEEGSASAVFLLCFYGKSTAMVRFTKIVVP